MKDASNFFKKILPVVITVAACTMLIHPIPFETVQAQNRVLEEQLTKEAIIKLTNQARSRKGLAKLAENEVLGKIAEYRARDMLAKQYFGHISPSGQEASDIAERSGYRYETIAENIVRGSFHTNQAVVDCWMQSPAHRKNILSTDVREIGVAIIKGTLQGQDTWVGVQILGLQARPRKSSAARRLQPEAAQPAVGGAEEQDHTTETVW